MRYTKLTEEIAHQHYMEGDAYVGPSVDHLEPLVASVVKKVLDAVWAAAEYEHEQIVTCKTTTQAYMSLRDPSAIPEKNQESIAAEREACAAICDEEAEKMEREAQAAINSGHHDEVSSLRSTAWKLSIAAARIRDRLNCANKNGE